MIQYIHKKRGEKKRKITTPLVKMYTQREQCGRAKRSFRTLN